MRSSNIQAALDYARAQLAANLAKEERDRERNAALALVVLALLDAQEGAEPARRAPRDAFVEFPHANACERRRERRSDANAAPRLKLYCGE